MDDNFLVELAADGEKKLEFAIPNSMTLGDALSNLKGTVDELVEAAKGWKDSRGLKSAIILEGKAWSEIFQKAYNKVAGDDLGLVTTIGEGKNSRKIIELGKVGNEQMQHFFVHGDPGAEELYMYFLFSSGPGPKMISSIEFGSFN